MILNDLFLFKMILKYFQIENVQRILKEAVAEAAVPVVAAVPVLTASGNSRSIERSMQKYRF